MKYRANTADQGKPIEIFLIGHCELGPRSALKRAFTNGDILVNGAVASRTTLLREGDQVEVRAADVFARAQLCVLPNAALLLQPILSTPELLVINKPSGISAHPVRPTEVGTALNAIGALFPEAIETFASNKPLEGGLVHRIDRGTSGLLACAKTLEAWTKLRELWRSRSVEKAYLAWVIGKPKASHAAGGDVQLYLSHDPKSKKRMTAHRERPKEPAWLAQTSVKFLRTIDLPSHGLTASLVLVQIHTGVMHQIRATLCALGYPVLGDSVYETAVALRGRHADALSLGLSRESEDFFSQIEPRLLSENPSGMHSIPRIGDLPDQGFFLHATWLRAPSVDGLRDGIVAPAPAYF